MSTLIMKFGGTSTGDADAFERAVDIVIAQIKRWDHIVVVVSAMEGVTDMLITCADLSSSSDNSIWKQEIDRLQCKLENLIQSIFRGDQNCQPLLAIVNMRIDELIDICQRVHTMGKISAQDMDEVSSLGERINVQVFSTLLRKRGIVSQAVEATELIVTDSCFQSASPIQSETDARIKAVLLPLFSNNVTPVVTGFIGATRDGKTTTLGRGGSDFTATILGKSLNADEVWIWTDVDGIMSADPKITSKARLIPEITYEDVYTLSSFGAKVLHPNTILPASQANIPIWVKNTFNPGCSGTKISNRPNCANNGLSAITGYLDISLLSVQTKPGGNLLKTKQLILETIKERNIKNFVSVHHENQGSINFAFNQKDTNLIMQTIGEELFLRSVENNLSHIEIKDDLAIITVIGRGLHNSISIRSKISLILEKSGIITQKWDHDCTGNYLSFLVDKKHGEQAIKIIHDIMLLHHESIPLNTQSVVEHLPAI